jgi:hypothetical protein
VNWLANRSASTPTAGRNWKQPHGATNRTQSSNKNGKGGSAWDKRQDSRKKDEAIKKLERCVPLPPLADATHPSAPATGSSATRPDD